jgi:hypothetical protein
MASREDNRKAFWDRVALTLWAAWIGVPSAFALLLAAVSYARWDSPPTDRPFVTPKHLGLQIGLALALGIAAFLFAAADVLVNASTHPARGRRRTVKVIAVLAVFVTLSPAAVRIVLPWEDPYDMTGSPLATLFGVIFFAGCSGVFFFVPAVARAVYVFRRKRGVEGRGE